MAFKCDYCEDGVFPSLGEIVEHVECKHIGKQLCYSQLEKHGDTWGWQKRIFNETAGSASNVSMPFKCVYCKDDTYPSLSDIVEHLKHSHGEKEICYSQLELHGKTLGWQRKNGRK